MPAFLAFRSSSVSVPRIPFILQSAFKARGQAIVPSFRPLRFPFPAVLVPLASIAARMPSGSGDAGRGTATPSGSAEAGDLPLGPVATLLLVVTLMISAFLASGQLYVAIPLANEVARHFDVPLSQAALIGPAFGLPYAAGFIVFGRLSDVFGRRHVLVWGQVATAIATVLVGLAPGFSLLLLARAVQGFAASAFAPSALALVSEILPRRHRPLGLALVSFAFMIAGPLAQLAGAWWPGGRTPLMLDIAPFYLLSALAIFFLATGLARPAFAEEEMGLGALRVLMRNRGIATVFIVAITGIFGFVTFYAGLVLVYPTQVGQEQHLRLLGAAPFLLAFAAAPLTHRFGPERTAALGLALEALALILASLGTPWLIPASLVLSAGMALALPGFIGTVSHRASPATRGLGLAIYSFTLFVGASLAPVTVHWGAPLGVFGVWLLPALALALAAGLMGLAGEG